MADVGFSVCFYLFHVAKPATQDLNSAAHSLFNDHWAYCLQRWALSNWQALIWLVGLIIYQAFCHSIYPSIHAQLNILCPSNYLSFCQPIYLSYYPLFSRLYIYPSNYTLFSHFIYPSNDWYLVFLDIHPTINRFIILQYLSIIYHFGILRISNYPFFVIHYLTIYCFVILYIPIHVPDCSSAAVLWHAVVQLIWATLVKSPLICSPLYSAHIRW